MSDDAKWISRVAAEPANNALRLAHAAALRETDAPRAEFIQAQVALTGKLDPASRRTHNRRAEDLLADHGSAWTEPLRKLGAQRWEFTRGYVESLSLPEEALAQHGKELLAREPVRQVTLETRDGRSLAEAAAQPWFEQVTWLRIQGPGVEAAAEALALAPHVGRLEVLSFRAPSEGGVMALVKSPTLTGLRVLSLSLEEADPEVLAQALASNRLALKRLFLSGARLGDEGAQGLTKCKTLGTLEQLALNRNELSDEGAAALARSKGLNALERLELSGNDLSEEGALAFKSPKALPHLKHLELKEMGLSDSDVEPLLRRLGKGLKL
ncbi:hypothetical protein DRW03_11030 [Corallococcus sp. H22C18031201]|nr:hypothetical protein DRW03_11030 [Corallococcus sp. H22C18031201]